MTGNAGLRLIGVIGLEAAVGLEHLEEEGKRDGVEHFVGIDGDEARLDLY